MRSGTDTGFKTNGVLGSDTGPHPAAIIFPVTGRTRTRQPPRPPRGAAASRLSSGRRGRVLFRGSRKSLRVDVLPNSRQLAVTDGDGPCPVVFERPLRGFDRAFRESDDHDAVSLGHELGRRRKDVSTDSEAVRSNSANPAWPRCVPASGQFSPGMIHSMSSAVSARRPCLSPRPMAAKKSFTIWTFRSMLMDASPLSLDSIVEDRLVPTPSDRLPRSSGGRCAGRRRPDRHGRCCR